MNIVHIIPKPIRKMLKPLFLAKQYLKFYNAYKRFKDIESQISHKEKIKVAFFATFASVWKYEYLYRLLEKHPRFDPIIIICPVINFGYDNMIITMNECYKRFSIGYNCIKSYDTETQKYLDVRNEINPDIIFFTSPYKDLVDSRYYIDQFLDKLTCYVSYGFNESNLYGMFYNLEIHNLVWKLYAETKYHLHYSQKYAYNKGINARLSGYPGIDIFLDKTYKYKDIWKIKDRNIKRIIWAPHHTFNPSEELHYSCFLELQELMLQLAKKYKNKIQIAFKPHPLLKVKLEKYWGKEKTDQYYKEWESLPNGIYINGDYIDLFLSSDAIIHESGSFIAEYLYTLKPAMHTTKSDEVYNEFNDFGKACLDVYYHGRTAKDIEDFIVNVIKEYDPLQQKRLEFYKKNLTPPNNKFASENILNDLINSLL